LELFYGFTELSVGPFTFVRESLLMVRVLTSPIALKDVELQKEMAMSALFSLSIQVKNPEKPKDRCHGR